MSPVAFRGTGSAGTTPLLNGRIDMDPFASRARNLSPQSFWHQCGHCSGRMHLRPRARLTLTGKPDREDEEPIDRSNGTRMRSGSLSRHRKAAGRASGPMLALCYAVSLSITPLQAQTQSQPRTQSRPQQQAPAPAPITPPVTAAPIAPAQPSLPPFETLSRQEQRALLRACVQEWEEMKRVGRSAGHHWKEFFEGCRLRGSRQ